MVRDRHRLRVEVQLARAERADHEVLALEGLVRGRRLVDPAGDRLEVVDGERPRIEVAVPADHVEGVVVDDVGLVAVADAHLDRELALVAVRVQRRRRMDVAVVVRRPLEQLAVLVAVAPRDLDQCPASRRRGSAARPVGDEPVGRAARDHDVVAVRVGHVAEDRLERARALVDEDALVALAVPEEVSIRSAGRQIEISTSLFHISSRRPVISSPSARSPRVEEPVLVGVGHPLVALDRLERRPPPRRGRATGGGTGSTPSR